MKKTIFGLSLAYSCLFYVLCQAQTTVRIIGSVKDSSTGELLPGANVFIDNTTIGVTSDSQGKFVLNTQVGIQTVVISFIGYESFHQRISLKAGPDYQLHVGVKPEIKFLETISVVSKKDKEWSLLMERFEKAFLGTSDNARSCQIQNPWVIEFEKKKDSLIAKSTEPVEILNERLGYTITFHLDRFYEKGEKFMIRGFAQFKAIQPKTMVDIDFWNENRRKAYQGSVRHFFQALIHGTSENEGFRIYIDKIGYQRTFRSENFTQELARAIDPLNPDSIAITRDTSSAAGYAIRVDRRLEIHYIRNISSKRLYSDISHQVSWIAPESKFIETNFNGVYSDLSSFSVAGSMSLQRIGDLLPFDYSYMLESEMSNVSNISGQILLKGAEKFYGKSMVFLGRTTIGTFSDNAGDFTLSNVKSGIYDLYAFHEGYSIFSSRIRVEEGKNYNLKIELKEISKSRKGSKIRSTAKSSLIKVLKDELIKSHKIMGLSDSVLILNEDALQFYLKNDSNVLFSKEALNLQIKPIGYQIHLCLNDLVITRTDTTINADYWYEPEHPLSRITHLRWTVNRHRLYAQSKEFFLKNLLLGTLKESGFELVNEWGDSVKIKIDTTDSRVPGYVLINLPEVFYVNGVPKLAIGDWYSPHATNRTKVSCPSGKVLVSKGGQLFDYRSISFEGQIIQNSIWSTPVDYEARFLMYNDISQLREDIITITDKDYYYPREYVWLSGFVFNKPLMLQDSLSKVIHFQLIDKSKKVIIDNIAEINNCSWTGYFHLPDTLKPNMYFLRVYTNWNRNYAGDLYIRPLPVLEFTTNFTNSKPQPRELQAETIHISSDKRKYKRREKVAISFKATSNIDGSPIELLYCSVSVTDTLTVKKVLDVPSPEISPNRKATVNEYEIIERGIPVYGYAYDMNGNPFRGQIQLIHFDTGFFGTSTTDEKGRFIFHKELKFYDSARLYLRALNQEGKYTSFTYKLEANHPPISSLPNFDFDLMKAPSTLERIVNNYQPSEDVIQLNDVVVEAKRIETLEERTSKTTILYGVPDKTISGKEISKWGTGSNWLQGLNGRIPGIRVQGDRVIIRGQSSLMGDNSPLFLVDGIPGSVNIDPSQIERVEIVKRAVPIYGSRGSGGIIAVYTKSNSLRTGNSQNQPHGEGPQSNESFAFKGFEPVIDFISPDHSKSLENKIDLRTTLYWNPMLVTTSGEGQFYFYSGDLETTYRVYIIAVTKDFKLISGYYHLNISD